MNLEVTQMPVKGPWDAVPDGERKQLVAYGQADALNVGSGTSVLQDAVAAQKYQVSSLESPLYHIDDRRAPTVLDDKEAHLGHERRLIDELLLNQANANIARNG